MTNEADIVAQNRAELEHLKALVARLSDEQLRCPLAAGWTASGVLAHLAFWDHRALTLIEKWQKGGIEPSPMDVDIVNESTRPLCLAIPPRAAVELAIACADKIDRIISQLPGQWIEEIRESGKTVHLDRGDHRRRHLEEIEKALGL